MSRLYLDACCIIYLVEAIAPFQQVVRRRVVRHRAEPDAVLVTSRLSRLECRVAPLRDGDDRLLGQYDGFFGARRVVVAEVTADVVELATVLRARHRFKTPDALHLATAIEQRVDAFLTGDAELARCTDLNVEVLTESAV